MGDLWLPARTGSEPGPAPVVVLIHGGYWRSIYTKAIMSRLARAVAARGWAAWNIEYRRTGALGGGGWPATLVDVAAALDHVARLADVDATRVITCGHSAGGCLALWAAAKNRTGAQRVAHPAVQPLAAVSLAGVVDLRRGAELGLGDNAVARFLGGSFQEHPDRYRSSSPAALVPLGVPQVLVHGLSDTVVPPSMSSRLPALGTRRRGRRRLRAHRRRGPSRHDRPIECGLAGHLEPHRAAVLDLSGPSRRVTRRGAGSVGPAPLASWRISSSCVTRRCD